MLRSKISMSVSAALLLGVVSITGCGTNNTASDKNVQTKSVRGIHDGRLGVNSMKVNAFDKMEMSRELADRIAAMPEVRSANVVVAGKSAYVAVTLDEASGGVHAKSYGNTAGIGGPTGMIAGNGRTSGRTTTGTTGMNDANGMTGNNGLSGTAGMNGTPGMRGSRTGVPGMTGVGGSINGMSGTLSTGTGTVGGTGTAKPGGYAGNGGNGIMSRSNMTDGRVLRNDIDRSMGTAAGTRTITPYSTNGMTNGTHNTGTLANDTMTRELKDKIAAEVRRYDQNIDNVYVSANPDFVERTNFYAQEFRAGHPLRGFAHEFSTMVGRIFPTRSGY
ncbi:YhcN/YlaJ family sporulation lipoprotein [Paenibacillus sp. P32E]|uniref:YhcN/YlaJ family sporulation lipoprotein n=1 Tax=Paenibacillus sp. P32E TaxID=1349434 RepID=UPI00093E9304|nr:YhcN/YlaJ family sporulation lipoprotein [Paenibacillus sp. P32E]OKP92949.1 hypothetical protein A3848_06105 [Paenibacillus sp. P32E]